jgi:hypothetical protein
MPSVVLGNGLKIGLKRIRLFSPLDSKSLDLTIIIAFDVARRAWNVRKKSAISLRILHELYVAVTRPQRRVQLPIWSFLRKLGYDFQTTGAEMLLREFDKDRQLGPGPCGRLNVRLCMVALLSSLGMQRRVMAGPTRHFPELHDCRTLESLGGLTRQRITEKIQNGKGMD